MDSSSDGSFAWTDASNDTIDSGDIVNDSMNKTFSEDESVSGKSYKKKLQDELFAQGNGAVKSMEQHTSNKRKRKLTEGLSATENESPKKNKIKKEPESDIDVSTKNYKPNGHNHSEPDDSYDESYLDLKVKAEQEFGTPSPEKAKKKRNKSLSNSDILHNKSCETEKKTKRKSKSHLCVETDFEDNLLNSLAREENEYQKNTRKKKKSKNKKDSSMSDETKHQYSCNEADETIERNSQPPTHYADASEANVTSQLDTVVPDNKTKNKKYSLEEVENSRNEETLAGKHQLNLSVSESVCLDVPDAAVRRTPRISERIQFEEDESSEMEISQIPSNKTSKKSSKLKTFLKNNSNLKPFSNKLKTDSALTVDDEIWIVKCPRDVDIDAFQNKHFTLEGKCKLKLNGQTYEGTVDSESRNMSILSSEQSNFTIKSLAVKGFLNLRKRIPKCHMQDEVMVNNQPNFMPLPETKCRHPLFGSNYKKSIKLPIVVVERLAASAPASATPALVAAPRRKRIHKDRAAGPDTNNHSLTTLKAEPRPGPESCVKSELETDQPNSCKKKQKRRKHLDSEEIAPKKKKRLKHNLESSEVWESEQAIEENLFNF